MKFIILLLLLLGNEIVLAEEIPKIVKQQQLKNKRILESSILEFMFTFIVIMGIINIISKGTCSNRRNKERMLKSCSRKLKQLTPENFYRINKDGTINVHTGKLKKALSESYKRSGKIRKLILKSVYKNAFPINKSSKILKRGLQKKKINTKKFLKKMGGYI